MAGTLCPFAFLIFLMISSLRPPALARIRQDVQSMQAYAIQDATGMVKLDAMENPHRLPPDLQQKLGQRLGALALNRYPDGSHALLSTNSGHELALKELKDDIESQKKISALR